MRLKCLSQNCRNFLTYWIVDGSYSMMWTAQTNQLDPIKYRLKSSVGLCIWRKQREW
uniref:Uncharacterized protein n=1 Tax=Anguilla anguilla TaxID=7936 RepID=A0A0E9XB42_ANGAN